MRSCVTLALCCVRLWPEPSLYMCVCCARTSCVRCARTACVCCARTAVWELCQKCVCVTQQHSSKIWRNNGSRSCNVRNQYARMCPSLVYTKLRQKIFPIGEVHAQCIRRHGCRKIFFRCSANVLRPNTEGGKNKPSQTVKTWFYRTIRRVPNIPKRFPRIVPNLENGCIWKKSKK